MSLKIRLDLLRDGNIINDFSYKVCLEIIDFWRENLGVNLTEENAQQYITHFSRALVRLYENQEIEEEIEAEVFKEIEESEFFNKAQEITLEINRKFNLSFNSTEEKYLIMVNCFLLSNLK